MKWSEAHFPTLRESPQEAEVISHQLMLRAGMIRRVASGIYNYLPLGWRAIRKFENIIREEMERAGAQEISMPIVQPRELWDESGRWSLYGKELARFRDRHENEFCLQPTSEEVVTDLLKRDLKSYRQLPLNLFQIQHKFRDEVRPRFGIMRGREFIMKDAYSFDTNEEGARKSYQKMRQAYRRIFTRAGLEFRPVQADTGSIGGSDSEEFVVMAQSGEDEVISCSKCDYAANQEKAVARTEHSKKSDEAPTKEDFETPGIRTIEELSTSLKIASKDLAKSMVLTDESGKIILCLLRGDHELNLVKLQAAIGTKRTCRGLRLAREDELQLWNLPKGSLGPQDFPKEHELVVDEALSLDFPYICGANREGFHTRNVVLTRDAKVFLQAVVRNVLAEETCAQCGGKLRSDRGIEVGHVFYLGTKYSEAMKLYFNAESGEETLAEMGCYGIGVGRSIAACIEQNHDQWGIIWPVALAPYSVGISSLGEGECRERAEKLYGELRTAGLDVLWDDRLLSPGVKLKDMDLIGIPIQVIFGDRALKNGQSEFKFRPKAHKEMLSLGQEKEKVLSTLREESERMEAQLKAWEVS